MAMDKSAGKAVHGVRVPMHSGAMEAQAFAQVITTINGALKASMEALFR
jgi:hypothetical protein